jgi:hypothetical protein
MSDFPEEPVLAERPVLPARGDGRHRFRLAALVGITLVACLAVVRETVVARPPVLWGIEAEPCALENYKSSLRGFDNVIPFSMGPFDLVSMCDRPDEVAYRWDDFAHAGWRAKAHYDKHGAVDMVVLECKTNDSFQPWRAAVIERSRRLAESFRLPDLGDALNRVITDVEARIVWPAKARANGWELEVQRSHFDGTPTATVEFRGRMRWQPTFTPLGSFDINFPPVERLSAPWRR